MLKTKRNKVFLITITSLLTICGGFLLYVNFFGGKADNSHSLKGKLIRDWNAAAMYVSTEAQFGYLSVYDWATGFNKISKIGWITDIHADRFKRRQVESGLLFPRQYQDYLPKVFDALRKEKINTVIATGDNVNSGDDGYARDLINLARQKDMRIIWVKGNHDSQKSMAAMGEAGNKYYSLDYLNTHIIVLDDTVGVQQTGDYTGGIDEEQLNWLRAQLKTSEPAIVALHVPIFPISQDRQMDDNNVILSKYSELEKILAENKNVKLVLFGHWHIPWQKQLDNLNFYGLGALTYDGAQGGYATINLNDFSVEYKTVGMIPASELK